LCKCQLVFRIYLLMIPVIGGYEGDGCRLQVDFFQFGLSNK
jgi:hypothetical protein